MVDSSARRNLSENLRRLVTGRMTEDAFDDVYVDEYCRSEDAAVKEIGEFGYRLFSGDIPLSYGLKGHHEDDEDARAFGARSVLFLRTELQYEWPPMPEQSLASGLLELLSALGFYLGVALMLVSLPCLIIGGTDLSVGLFFGLPGIVLFGFGVFYLFRRPNLDSAEWQAYRASGDPDVWPFVRQTDFGHARKNNHLLGATSYRTD